MIDNVEFVDRLFKLLNMVVDVAFKFEIDVVWLFIDNVEFVDKLFKLLNTVVDVAFKLFIDSVELVDNEFKLLNMVLDVVLIPLIADVISDPLTFNDEKIVALFDNKLNEVISYMPELFIL